MPNNDMNASTGPIGGRAMRASAWALSGMFYGRAVNLLMTIILARILVPEDFGLVALATTLLLILTAVTDLSLGAAIIHHREVSREDYDTAFSMGLLRGILLAAIMVASGYAMAAVYGDPRLIAVTAALGLRPLFSGLSSPRYVMLAKELDFGRVARTEALAFTAQLAVSIAVALATGSYWAIVAGAVAASVTSLVSTYVLAPYRPRWSLASWRRFLGFSIWLTLTQLVTMVGNRFDNFLVGGFLGTAVFGAYSVGNNISAMITQSAIQPLEKVLFPSFAKLTHDRDRLAAAFSRSQASLLAIGLPLGIGFALVAEPFVYLTLGPRWDIAVIVIQFIAPILGLQVVFGPANSLAYALGATRTLFNRSLFMMLFRVPVVFAGLFYFGLIGLLVARAGSGIVHSLVNVYMVRRLIGVSPLRQVAEGWRSLVSAVVMTAAVLGVRWELGVVDGEGSALIALVVLVATGAIAYCGTHAALWLIAGRPGQGIETEIAALANRAAGRLALRRQRNPAE